MYRRAWQGRKRSCLKNGRYRECSMGKSVRFSDVVMVRVVVFDVEPSGDDRRWDSVVEEVQLLAGGQEDRGYEDGKEEADLSNRMLV